MERRDFLKRAIKLSFSLLLLALISMIAYVYPSNLSRRKVRYVYLMDEDDLPRKGVKRVNYQYAVEDRTVGNRVFLAVTGNGLVAFSPVCTHLGCFVSWGQSARTEPTRRSYSRESRLSRTTSRSKR